MEYFEDGDNLDNWIHFFPKYYCDFIGYCKINEDGDEDDEQFTLLKMYRKFFLLGNTTDEWIDHNDLEKMTSCYDSDADNNDTPTKSAMRSKMSSTEQCGINLLIDASSQKGIEDNGKGSVTGDENEELKKEEDSSSGGDLEEEEREEGEEMVEVETKMSVLHEEDEDVKEE